jgi:glycine/D-amino acid oxidase-like deaminating enzyme
MVKMNDEERGFRQSLWQKTATQGFDCPQLSADISADVVIIGGGFTGLSAALHLSEFGKSVVLLEAHEIAWGASGRNGGQVNPGWKLLPSQIKALYDQDRGTGILKFIDGACDLVFDLIERHKIDCAPRRVPYFRAAYGERGIKEVEEWVRQWGQFGAPVTLRNERETHELMGSTFFHGGMEDARGGSLQPLSYAYGLATAAKAAGAQLFAQSRAYGIDRVKGDWVVTTGSGAKVEAKYLIIATNGYTDNLWPGLKRQIVPVASLQASTRPLSDEILATLLPRGHHLSDTRRSMIYCRIDETGRFQIGGRSRSFSPTLQQADTAHLQAEALRIFPQLKDVEWQCEWGGLVAMTKNHVPHLIELGENAYAGLGYDGRGVAMGTAMGKQLGCVIAGEEVAMPRECLSPFAFHRFRNAGITWHMISGRLMDRFR